MSTRDYATELQQAQTDLAFALAQGDPNAEDAADARIARIEREWRIATEQARGRE